MSIDALHLMRDLAPQVLGVLARRHGDFAAAEDAVQEALVAAVAQWPVAGVPTNPHGWLYQVAVRRLRDHVRSEMSRRQREDVVAREQAAHLPFINSIDNVPAVEEDDTLVLLFMCCHPSLSPPSAIALTLRAVGGLTTTEIASAFMVPESTMAQRISRAKSTIKSSGVPFSRPSDGDLADRVQQVMHVLYLMFNEGYTSTSGDSLHRVDLSNEAIRLTRIAHALLPDDSELAGLLALMLLTDARRSARTGSSGELIPLDEQDRSLWNGALIAEGAALVDVVLRRGTPGPYTLQAAIARVHDESASIAETDWRTVHDLYAMLEVLHANPMVTLNRAIALAMIEGPPAGMRLLETLDHDPHMRGHYRMDAVRAHLLELSGDMVGATAHYHAAASRTTSIPERNYLLLKAARLNQVTHATSEQ